MSRRSPYRITLTRDEREELLRRANKYTLPYFMVVFLAKMLSAPEKRVIPCYERLNRKCELNQESSPTPGWSLPAICEQG